MHLIGRSLVKRRRLGERCDYGVTGARAVGSAAASEPRKEEHPFDPQPAPRDITSTRVTSRWNPGLSLPGNQQSFNRSSLGL